MTINKHKVAIVWLRRDLRLRDNLALSTAIAKADSVVIVYIHAPCEEGKWEIGAASKCWLHHSLKSLASQLEEKSARIVFRKSDSSLKTLLEIAEESKATLITWNRLYDPELIKRDTEIKKSLKQINLEVETFNGSLLIEPWELKTTTGGPYQVFTPFWRTLQRTYVHEPTSPIPKQINDAGNKLNSDVIEDWNLLPKIPWDTGFNSIWEPGEKGALKRLKNFLRDAISNYKQNRDFPSLSGSSNLSPHLHFGEVSAHYIWEYIQNNKTLLRSDAEPFLRQLGWRDFAHHLLFHFPHTDIKPLKKDFERFPWEKNKKLLKAWQRGQTGFPIVDAGMRELWHTGIMHNRVRMIVGSILVKNLRIHWLEGAKWFWDCLVDADLPNNSLGWQWIAGSGADAAPYFRIFNPVSQSEKFDAEGIYIRKWVPELSLLPNKWIHKPWEASENILKDAKISLGKDYPKPIVDLKASREEALEAYYSLKNG